MANITLQVFWYLIKKEFLKNNCWKIFYKTVILYISKRDIEKKFETIVKLKNWKRFIKIIILTRFYIRNYVFQDTVVSFIGYVSLGNVKYLKYIAKHEEGHNNLHLIFFYYIAYIYRCSLATLWCSMATLCLRKISIARKRKFVRRLSDTDIRMDDLTRMRIDVCPIELRLCERIFELAFTLLQ